ncbi:DNA alkylation repair protein [Mucilaginibacter paludis]|uniref:DNA alkylation repair enzyme n=1 Tax=Mucilaginibacter paludis DSM 18603 TaxID=714943 RepID=H1Y1F0_9SPHI|nr:DNA alkylation repair protein [Mucilaginibacter paludis]EHQ30284.1 DNA alkylation repair enzyme [Mucilaginibacter paludis DSM 18603]
MDPIKEELLQLLVKAAKTNKPSKFKDLKKYIGTNYDLIGLSVPGQRLLFKKGFSFSRLPVDKQLEIWDQLWTTSRQYEIMNFALMFVSQNERCFEPAFLWDTLKNWVKQVDNWAHSDSLSSVYAHLLEKEPSVVYAQYMLWNKSANPWERRQSVVGTLYYSRIRKSLPSFEKLLAMLSTLLTDENYFVQKGVGWALREMGNVYPAQTLALLQQQIAAIHPVAFTAAIEKLDTAKKDELKQLRKFLKKQQKTPKQG